MGSTRPFPGRPDLSADMNPESFPLPPPVEPLPLDVWLDRTDRAEVGREAFFRGREAEYEVFRRAVRSLQAGQVGGGTMVFQGAPGAGKSALMAECLEAVRRHSTPEDPWVAVTLKPDTLQFPVAVVRALIRATEAESQRLRAQASATTTRQMLESLRDRGQALYRELSARGGGAIGVSVGGRPVVDQPAEWVFENAAPLLATIRLVVCVDEAQNTPVEPSTKAVLDCLHDPPGQIPLVTAFFGLSDTRAMLRRGGLSRLADERIVTLEPLAENEAVAALGSVFAAYGFPGTATERTQWVEQLAALSQGWPQHLNRVAVAAMRVLQDHRSGALGEAALTDARTRGRERMESYYAARLEAGSAEPEVYRQLAEAAAERDGLLSTPALDALTEAARQDEPLDAFLTDALHAGLLAPVQHPPKHYRIPIPSLGDYLRALPVDSPTS